MVSSTDITIRATQALSEFRLDCTATSPSPGSRSTASPPRIARDGRQADRHTRRRDRQRRVFHAVVAYSGRRSQFVDSGRLARGLDAHDPSRRLRRSISRTARWAGSRATTTRATRRRSTSTSPSPSTHAAFGNGELVVQGRQRRQHDDLELAHGLPDGDVPEHVDGRALRLPRRAAARRRPTRRLGRSGRPLEIYNAIESALTATQKSDREQRPPAARTRSSSSSPTRSARRTRSSRTARSCTAPRRRLRARGPDQVALLGQRRSASARSRTRSRTSGSATASPGDVVGPVVQRGLGDLVGVVLGQQAEQQPDHGRRSSSPNGYNATASGELDHPARAMLPDADGAVRPRSRSTPRPRADARGLPPDRR